jgi:hypothetical protein
MNQKPTKKSGIWKQQLLALAAIGFSSILLGCGGGGGGSAPNPPSGQAGACGSPAGSTATVVCGTVQDNSGQVVPGATVQMYNKLGNPTGSPVTSNTSGRYVINSIPSDAYMYAVTPPANAGYVSNVAALFGSPYFWQSGAPKASDGTLCMPLLSITPGTDTEQGVIALYNSSVPPPAPASCPR